MIATVGLRPRRRLLLAVLVTGLLAGLVGMHHLASDGSSMSHESAGSDPSMTMPVDGPARGGPHDPALLHLCLAVLGAVAVAAVATLVLWWHPVAAPEPAVRPARRVSASPRAPPDSASARLALLCVLRT